MGAVRTGIRILHTADSHIGAELPIRPRLARPRRGDDFLDSFLRVVHVAREERVDLLIHSGDLFDSPRPSARALMAASLPLKELADEGIAVIIVPGNHERSAIPASLFLAHPGIAIVREPCTLAFEIAGARVAVSAMPCIRRGAGGGFAGALDATGWAGIGADVRVLALHQAIDSAVCSPADYRFRAGDDVIARRAIPASFDYVAAGHVHRHQRLAPAAGLAQQIVYAGSPDRITFAEKDEAKGCVLVAHDGARIAWRFVEHEVRPMRVHPLVATARERDRLREEIEGVLSNAPPRAVVQVRLAGPVERGALRGLRIADVAERLRPDVLLSISYRGVEFEGPATEATADDVSPVNGDGPGGGHGGRRTASILEPFAATPLSIVRASPDRLARLPAVRGVYTLYDAEDRLLYVGKAADLRARVRTHLRDLKRSNFFHAWPRQVTRVEAVQLDGDAAAVALEAELINRHRPPYNRAK